MASPWPSFAWTASAKVFSSATKGLETGAGIVDHRRDLAERLVTPAKAGAYSG
jgi:hypothetical protein